MPPFERNKHLAKAVTLKGCAGNSVNSFVLERSPPKALSMRSKYYSYRVAVL